MDRLFYFIGKTLGLLYFNAATICMLAFIGASWWTENSNILLIGISFTILIIAIKIESNV